MHHLVVCDGQLRQVLGEGVLVGVDLPGLRVTAEEVEWQGAAQVEAQGFEHQALHGTDVLLGVGVVGDVDKVVDLGGVHLLVLRGDQHGGHTHQLQLATANLLQLEQERFWGNFKIPWSHIKDEIHVCLCK